MYRILIVEDDAVIAEAIMRACKPWGWQAKCAENLEDVLGEFVRFDAQLVLMDIALPFYNGYYWCTQIRKVSNVPIIFISSSSDNMNVVMAVNMGGDDFIAKPFDLSVLIAKVQAMLRRTYDFAGTSELMECDGVIFNTANGTLQFGDTFIELTRNEQRIMRLLLEKRGHIVSRCDMMTRLWESDSFVDENTLSVNVTRLRKKLGEAGLSRLIKTKKGCGYIIE